MILLILACTVFAVAIYIGLDAITVRQKQLALSLKRAKGYGGRPMRDAELNRDARERLFAPALGRLAHIAMKLPMTASTDEVGRRLMAAGLNGKMSTTTFLGLKTGAAGASMVFGVLMLLTGTSPGKAVLVGLGGAVMCFMLPDTYLTKRTRRRREEIGIQLPDTLDLLTVSVEAGLGFDAALARVCDHMEGPLVDEVSLTLHEMRIGEGRQQALRNMAERIQLADITGFTRAIIQADQLGMSLGRILRVQSNDMRNKRQMLAEQKAMKAPIKMLFPTVLFIFPAMFVVVLGPAMMTLGDIFASV
jgi:tight adherence protein C